MKTKIIAKIIASLLMCSPFACAEPTAQAGPNAAGELLQAPGFEELSPGPLKVDAGVWAINSSYPGGAVVIEDAKGAHSGKHYLAVNKAAESKTFVSVLPAQSFPNHGNQYLFKIWAKGSGKILLGLINLNGKEFLPPRAEDPQPKWFALSDDWEEFSVSMSPDGSATHVMFFIHATDQADLDDASLRSDGEVGIAPSPGASKNESSGDGYKSDFSKEEKWPDWKSPTAVGQFLWNKNQGHAGNGALEIAIGSNCPDDAVFCFSKYFPATPGKTYNAVVWVKAEGLTADAKISLAFQGKDAEKKFLGTPVMETVLLDADIVEGWQRRVLTFTVPNEGLWAKTAFLLCTIGVQKSPQGRVLFDDFEFFENK